MPSELFDLLFIGDQLRVEGAARERGGAVLQLVLPGAGFVCPLSHG